jgi:hypothetical protein
MSLTRIKTGEPQVIPDERRPAYHLGSHPNQAAQRAEAPNRPRRRDRDAPPVGQRANPAPASAGPWASLVCDARIW